MHAMNDPNRREFLLTAGTAVALGAMAGPLPLAASGAESEKVGTPDAIPPHRPLSAPGVHLYTDSPRYAAGDTLTAFVSATIPCKIEIVRLGDDLDGPGRDEVLHTVKIEQAQTQ